MRCSGIKQHSGRDVVDRKHTQYNIWCFLGFFGAHVEETAVAVVGVVGGELLAGGDTALLLSRCSGVAGELGKTLGTLVGVVPHYTTLITSDSGLVLLVRNGNGIASGSGSGVGVVVVVVRGSGWCAVVVVVVVASWLGVSSTPILITGARVLHRWLIVSRSETST